MNGRFAEENWQLLIYLYVCMYECMYVNIANSTEKAVGQTTDCWAEEREEGKKTVAMFIFVLTMNSNISVTPQPT